MIITSGRDLTIGQSSKNLKIDNSSTAFLVQDDNDQKGLENAGDYEGNFTPRSLATKQFVESLVNASGGLNYLGLWDASTNTPTISDGVGAKW